MRRSLRSGSGGCNHRIAWTGLLAALALAQPAIGRAQPDELPFARNEIPVSYPRTGVSIGVGWYVTGFESVESAFRAIEHAYSAGGYTVPSGGGVDPGPIIMPSLNLRVRRWLDVSLQGGLGGEKNDKLTLLGGLVSGRTTPRPGGRISLFAGIGGGTYQFKFQRDYGVQVTPPDGAGGYYVLDSITLEGKCGYWTTATGVSIRLAPEAALDASVQYFGMGDVSTDATQAGRVTVNMSGTMVAVWLTTLF